MEKRSEGKIGGRLEAPWAYGEVRVIRSQKKGNAEATSRAGLFGI